MNLLRSLSTLRLWVGYAAMCIGMFMAILDTQIVITSLPAIQDALGIGADRMSWLQTAYLIAEVVAIPLTGLLTRVFTMRWLYVGAIAAFTIASIGCAFSGGFTSLVVWRILQGFAGGVLIPLVFSAIFLLFDRGFEQTLATTMGGVLAVLAPALGPISGGWLTENYSWQWLFLINVGPGIAAMLVAYGCLPPGIARIALLKTLDWMSLLFIAVALAALEIGLKEAPDRGWNSAAVLGLFILFAAGSYAAFKRHASVIDFSLLGDRNLAFGCCLSFILGVGLFGSVYLMPVFLAFVRGHGPIDIGLIILVTGIAQLATAPVAVQLDRRCSARLLSAVGFFCFAIGLALSGFQSRATDYDEMFWPQVIRGSFVALCILPPIRFALGYLPIERVADASGLFNLSRNLGGAIGIALIDTVLFARGPEHAGRLTELVRNNPGAGALALQIGAEELPDPGDPLGMLAIMDAVEEASLTLAINEAWLMLSFITMLGLVVLWILGPVRGSPPPVSADDRLRLVENRPSPPLMS